MNIIDVTENWKTIYKNEGCLYHVAGWDKGLYFLYLTFHAIFSLHLPHSPVCCTWRICFVRMLVSCLVLEKPVAFLCFCGLALLVLPRWLLILAVSRNKKIFAVDMFIWLILLTILTSSQCFHHCRLQSTILSLFPS